MTRYGKIVLKCKIRHARRRLMSYVPFTVSDLDFNKTAMQNRFALPRHIEIIPIMKL